MSSMPATAQIDAVRAFNRFYTRRLGLVRGGLVRTPPPLAEARVLYELGQRGELETTALRTALDVDAGQLSRLIPRLGGGGLVRAARPPPGPAGRRRPAQPPDHAAGGRGPGRALPLPR